MTGFVVFLKEFIALYCLLHWALYQENLNNHSWIISCPDGITPNSGLAGLKNTYIYIYMRARVGVFVHNPGPYNPKTRPIGCLRTPKGWVSYIFNKFSFLKIAIKSISYIQRETLNSSTSHIYIYIYKEKW